MGKIINYNNFDVLVSSRDVRGVSQEFESVLRPPVALCVARNPDGELLLVRQFRNAVNEIVLEFPAGRAEANEDISMTAIRELREETGFEVSEYQQIGKIQSAPHFSNEEITIFMCDGGINAEPSPTDKEEFTEVSFYGMDDIAHMVRSGEIMDAKTISAFYLYGASLIKEVQ